MIFIFLENCPYFMHIPFLPSLSLSFSPFSFFNNACEFRSEQRETASMGTVYTLYHLLGPMHSHMFNIQKFHMDCIDHWRCSGNVYFGFRILAQYESNTISRATTTWATLPTTTSTKFILNNKRTQLKWYKSNPNSFVFVEWNEMKKTKQNET